LTPNCFWKARSFWLVGRSVGIVFGVQGGGGGGVVGSTGRRQARAGTFGVRGKA